MRRRAGTEQEWRERIARRANFDGTIAAFCEHEGVHQKAFYVWRKRLAARPESQRAVEFVEVGGAVESAVEIVSAGGTVVRVRGAFNKATLRRALEVLAEG